MITPTNGPVAQRKGKQLQPVQIKFYNVSVDYSTKKPAVKLPAKKIDTIPVN